VVVLPARGRLHLLLHRLQPVQDVLHVRTTPPRDRRAQRLQRRRQCRREIGLGGAVAHAAAAEAAAALLPLLAAVRALDLAAT
jgi:hypothetical protein